MQSSNTLSAVIFHLTRIANPYKFTKNLSYAFGGKPDGLPMNRKEVYAFPESTIPHSSRELRRLWKKLNSGMCFKTAIQTTRAILRRFECRS